MTSKIIVRKVWMNNTTRQLFVTIPRKKGIRNGDYVKITRARIG